jgi:hypothetical protein
MAGAFRAEQGRVRQRLGREPSLEEVIDKRAQVVAQNQQDRKQDNRKENDDQGKFHEILTAAVGW